MDDNRENLFIGIDLGSSFIKISLVNSSQNTVHSVCVPETQLQIKSPQYGWAQQDPEHWWKVTKQGLHLLLNNKDIDRKLLKGIGISYQMHGLVLIDENLNIIRPSIIWCDGRATKIGEQLYQKLKQKNLDKIILNHPSNFTLSKLLWVKKNQPQVYRKIYKILLPGDYIAMKLSGKVQTTSLGLSEATLWDYQTNKLCDQILELQNIDPRIIPQIVQNFQIQCKTSQIFNNQFNIKESIPIYYRSGDQPNNAFSLNALSPGQMVATGGTSGVLYAITDKIQCDQTLKFNSFLHVNHKSDNIRRGKLLCISGCGSVYRWIKQNLCGQISYQKMNELADQHDSDGIVVIPFGNGPERMLQNKDVKCEFLNINFTRHKLANIVRACIEGIAFSFMYGANLMKQKSIDINKIKAGKGNIFQSSLFCHILSTVLDVNIELYNTNGAQGAAKASIFASSWKLHNNRLQNFPFKIQKIKQYIPDQSKRQEYKDKYEKWCKCLQKLLVDK